MNDATAYPEGNLLHPSALEEGGHMLGDLFGGQPHQLRTEKPEDDHGFHPAEHQRHIETMLEPGGYLGKLIPETAHDQLGDLVVPDVQRLGFRKADGEIFGLQKHDPGETGVGLEKIEGKEDRIVDFILPLNNPLDILGELRGDECIALFERGALCY